MEKTLYFVAPCSDTDSIVKSCTESRTEFHWHTIPDAHNTALFLLLRPRTAMYLGLREKYPTFPDITSDAATLSKEIVAALLAMYPGLREKYPTFPDITSDAATIGKEIVAAFPPSVGLTEQDNTHSALDKIHTTLGMAAMHPHR